MKKLIMLLAITISTLSAFANDEKINQKVLHVFQTEFTTAKDVRWVTTSDYVKAEFLFNDQHVNAFYTMDGELLGITRNITSLDLPMNLQTGLKKSYADFWISDLFEVTRSDSTGYYITLENAENVIVLKASADNEWSVFKKTRKA